ncbi:MAG TPA: hypothetical protein VNU01_04655 [Egibacteraceae bacterium]|nr:hypothetical protein [Egibacteraceae bacterium]
MRRSIPAALVLLATLSMVACAGGTPPSPADGQQGQTQAAVPGELPAAPEDTTWYDDVEMAQAQVEADVDTVWLAGWFAPEALDGPTVADMEPRHRKAWGLSPDPTREELARAAFAALEGEGPVDLLHPLEGVQLRLLSAGVEDRDGGPTAVLDFGAGISATNQLGSAGGQAAKAQFLAMVAHYFPDARQVVVTVEGRDAPALFHDEVWDAPVPLEPTAGQEGAA